jgi:hypothetical protein
VVTDEPFAATRRALADQLSAIDGVLPGSVVTRLMRCGNKGCACRADPPTLHGPYIQWSRSVGGKTITRYLSAEELERYQEWFDNARRLKDIVAKLEIASIHALDAAAKIERQRSTRSARRTPNRTSRK